MRIGYHVQREGQSLLESLQREYKNIQKIKPKKMGVVFQVFIAGPKSFTLHTLTEDEIDSLADFLRVNDIFLVFHGTYLDRPFDGNRQALKSVIAQMNVAELLNKKTFKTSVIGPVVHMSKVSRTHGIGPLGELNNSLVALETDAYHFDAKTDVDCLAELDTNIRALVHQKNTYIIFDTAHIFESGINLSDPKTMKLFTAMIRGLIDDLNILPGFHLNDSFTPLGSAIDQHEVLGRGHIFKANKKSLKILIDFLIDIKSFAILENPPSTVDEGVKLVADLVAQN